MIYKCIKPCIAKSATHRSKIQVRVGDKYRLDKQIRNTIGLKTIKNTIHVTEDQLRNNFRQV